MDSSNIWLCRQNSCKKTDETDMFEIIRNNKIMTNPSGPNNTYYKHYCNDTLNNISDDSLNEMMNNDSKFIKDINLNDFCIIPYNKSQNFLLVKIISKAYLQNITDLIRICDNHDNMFHICNINKINEYSDYTIGIVRSYIRDIEIIADIVCEKKYRKFGGNSFYKIIDNDILTLVRNILNKPIKIEVEQTIVEIINKESIVPIKVSDEIRHELLKLKNLELYNKCQGKGIKCTKRTNKKKYIELLLQYELEEVQKEEVQKEEVQKEGILETDIKPKRRLRKKEI